MPTYLIGDIQGCDSAFEQLLQHISFSPSRDTLYLLGDLINRGPASAEVLRRCMCLGDAVKPLLGNHDLHLLARYLQSPRGQRLLMVHAGVLPQWSLEQALELADEVHQQIKGDALPDFLQHMYGNLPDRWSEQLTGSERTRVIVNALTRIRFCTADGRMDFESSESADAAPEGLMPWFECPQRQTAQDMIAFGHWSTLGLLNRPKLMGLDTGCIWGGCLSAMEIGADFQERQLHQIHCEQAQKPG